MTELRRDTLTRSTTDSTDLDDRRERPCGHTPWPHFDLKASDISADLVVDFWVKVNLLIRDNVRQGYTRDEAVALARKFYFIPHYDGHVLADEKLNAAGEVAAQMRAFTPRKIAD